MALIYELVQLYIEVCAHLSRHSCYPLEELLPSEITDQLFCSSSIFNLENERNCITPVSFGNFWN